jgi:hypothetical protein
MFDPLEILGTRAANHAHYSVAFFQKKISQVGTILASYAGDNCCFHLMGSR